MDDLNLDIELDFTKKLDDDLTLLNEEQVARITGRSVATLRTDRQNRTGITYIKIGRSIRYSLADIRQYIDECRREALDTDIELDIDLEEFSKELGIESDVKSEENVEASENSEDE